MSEETDNLVLRLLRELRSDQQKMMRKLERHDEKFEAIERRMEDVNESVGMALGLAAHSNIAYETTGQRLDKMSLELEALKERLDMLETEGT